MKEGHTLIRTGPYRIVRHPIYAGLLLALSGTALAIGEWRGVLAVALATFAFALRMEAEDAGSDGPSLNTRNTAAAPPR